MTTTSDGEGLRRVTGWLLAIGWSVTVSLAILRTGILWRWVGWTGLVASVPWAWPCFEVRSAASSKGSPRGRPFPSDTWSRPFMSATPRQVIVQRHRT